VIFILDAPDSPASRAVIWLVVLPVAGFHHLRVVRPFAILEQPDLPAWANHDFLVSFGQQLPHADSSAACAIVKLAGMATTRAQAMAPGRSAAMKSAGIIAATRRSHALQQIARR
jgi:hypothetical protein